MVRKRVEVSSDARVKHTVAENMGGGRGPGKAGDSGRHVEIYTDGACSGNGLPGARAGVGVHCPKDRSIHVSQPISGRQTNQRAELEAATRGIKAAKSKGYDSVTVKTDSHYVMKGAQSNLPRWESNGWAKNVTNKRDFQNLGASMSGMNVNFEYVPRKENMADPLARQGAKRR